MRLCKLVPAGRTIAGLGRNKCHRSARTDLPASIRRCRKRSGQAILPGKKVHCLPLGRSDVTEALVGRHRPAASAGPMPGVVPAHILPRRIPVKQVPLVPGTPGSAHIHSAHRGRENCTDAECSMLFTCLYPLIPPDERPLIKDFWNNRNTINAGIMPMIAAAAIRCHLAP